MTGRSARNRLLVVDDSPDTRELIQRNLSSQGYEVLTAGGVAEAMEILRHAQVDLVITDLKMPRTSGLELVRHVRDALKDTEVIAITGYPSVEGAVAAVKLGAEEYLTKPFTQEELFAAVRHAIEKAGIAAASRGVVDGQMPTPLGIVGESESMQKVIKAVSRAAAATTSVLVTGENGTGKRLVAHAIHRASARAGARFVVVDCGGVSEDLVEKQLLGEASDTSARGDRAVGFYQFAEGGTLFLRDVSELPRGIQDSLLRVLEDKTFCPVGSTRSLPAGFRLIAASRRDLRPLVSTSAFREDLFVRLSINSIAVPPLRERGDDVVLLAAHFAERFARDVGRPVPRFSADALEAIKGYSWPGNVGELQDCIERLVLTTNGGAIEVSDLPDAIRHSTRGTAARTRSLHEMEGDYIRMVLASVAGNKTRAAEILGINRKTLREKLREQALGASARPTTRD
jgi:DNA-binding NtrC family response regulator